MKMWGKILGLKRKDLEAVAQFTDDSILKRLLEQNPHKRRFRLKGEKKFIMCAQKDTTQETSHVR